MGTGASIRKERRKAREVPFKKISFAVFTLLTAVFCLQATEAVIEDCPCFTLPNCLFPRQHQRRHGWQREDKECKQSAEDKSAGCT